LLSNLVAGQRWVHCAISSQAAGIGLTPLNESRDTSPGVRIADDGLLRPRLLRQRATPVHVRCVIDGALGRAHARKPSAPAFKLGPCERKQDVFGPIVKPVR
jgi:hypothetical protein